MRALVLLIGLFMIADAEAQVVTAPPFVDPRQDMVAPKPGSATATVAAPPAIPTAERAPVGNPLWTIPLASLATTRERPVFSPSRRPPPPPVVVAKAPPPPPPPPKPAEPEKPQLVLVGTVLAETGEGIGLFMNSADMTALRLKVGQDHKGWVLREVRPRQVVLEKGQQNAVLELPRRDMMNKGGSVPPPAAQANRKTDTVVDEVAATSSSPNNNPKATRGFVPPPPRAPDVPQIVIQPPVLTPSPLPVNPFQKAGLR